MIEPATARAIIEGRCGDPFGALGLHEVDGKLIVRAFIPGAEAVEAMDAKSGRKVADLAPVEGAPGLFAGRAGRRRKHFVHRLRVTRGGECQMVDDPYRFGPILGEMDLHLIGEGTHRALWRALGAHPRTMEGVAGVAFAVWAPNAARVSVVGDFNGWDGRVHAMRNRGGVWEIFIPGLTPGATYKYELLDAQGDLLPLRADPVGFGAEHAPATASVVRSLDGRDWTDGVWMDRRAAAQAADKPVSIYEVHLGSWKRKADEENRPLTYRELADELVAYVKDMGFTHIETTPISEFPYDGSWGYQPIGLYAPTARHGDMEAFRDFVEACHAADIGLILDWVPGHFPADAHGLRRFDGTALYEHLDPREGFHPDWNTMLYNYGRNEVRNFLTANALYWLEEHHVDGLRVDAVASMLYRDYSRKEGEWVPNIHGGRENLEAIAFLREANAVTGEEAPGAVTIAEESTAFPGVSAPVADGGLGFDYKWNMGWMNDTLAYMAEDPIHRKHHHDKMTFGLVYAFSERFVLPLSHDEVVHGKGSLLAKMSGLPGDKYASLRAYFGFMWGHPGKKLLFMGCEFAQAREWNHDAELDWGHLDDPRHAGMQRLVRDLNHLYTGAPALHQRDARADGFDWVEVDARDESLFAWIRHGEDGAAPMLVVSNFTPVERSGRRIGVPAPGRWAERLNTDAEVYGGRGRGNLGGVDAEEVAASGREHSIVVTVPPLTTLFFERERD